MKNHILDPYGEDNWDDDIIIEQVNHILENLRIKLYGIMTDSLTNEFYSPNNIETRHRILYNIRKEMKSDRFFDDYEYRIICDETNNPPELVEENRVRICINIRKTTELSIYVFQSDARINQIIPPSGVLYAGILK